jgi:hypothetical protein
MVQAIENAILFLGFSAACHGVARSRGNESELALLPAFGYGQA